MSKANLLLIFSFFIIHQINAQTDRLYVQGGVTCTQINSSVIADQEFKFGDTYHVGLERESDSQVLFSIGIGFASMGSKFNGQVIDSSLVVTEFQNIIDLNYLSVPIKIGKKIGRENFVYGNIGFSNRFLMSAKEKAPIFNENLEISGQQTDDITSELKRYDLVGLIEFGAGKQLVKHELSISCLFTLSATPIGKENFFIGSKPRNIGGVLSLNYSYSF